jgi:LemA protein
MKNKLFISAVFGSLLAVAGCDVNKHASDLGFKQGDDLVEKGTIKYDLLVDKDEECNAKWADYESNLQRRADMVPQLVGVVKGAAANETAALVAVTQARASATRPEIKLDPKNDDMSDPAKFAAYQQAQSNLGATLGRLMVASENYPTITSTDLFRNLQVQIEGTENRLNTARHDYNLAAADYNKELRHVSGKVLNPLTGHEFKPRVYFSADEGARQAPSVDFGTPAADKAVQPASK